MLQLKRILVLVVPHFRDPIEVKQHLGSEDEEQLPDGVRWRVGTESPMMFAIRDLYFESQTSSLHPLRQIPEERFRLCLFLRSMDLKSHIEGEMTHISLPGFNLWLPTCLYKLEAFRFAAFVGIGE